MTNLFDSPGFRESLRAEMEEIDRQEAEKTAWLAAHRADPPVPVESLVLERNDRASSGTYIKTEGAILSLPPVNAGVDSWRYRVYLGRGQAIVGFGKHLTIGVGFFDEPRSEGSDLPWRTHASRIWNHVKDNKGTHDVSDEACLRAIEMVQEAAAADNPGERVETEAESRERSSYLWDDPEWNMECDARSGEHSCIYHLTDHSSEIEGHKCTCGEEWNA